MVSGTYYVKSDNNNNDIISFYDNKQTYEVSKQNNKSRFLVKITNAHIYPITFQKISVKLTTKLLSDSELVTNWTCILTGQLQRNTALNIADFIEFINLVRLS